jgi:hypothetical protein
MWRDKRAECLRSYSYRRPNSSRRASQTYLLRIFNRTRLQLADTEQLPSIRVPRFLGEHALSELERELVIALNDKLLRFGEQGIDGRLRLCRGRVGGRGALLRFRTRAAHREKSEKGKGRSWTRVTRLFG